MAEWLKRMTRNHIPSGAQVRVLLVSTIQFYFFFPFAFIRAFTVIHVLNIYLFIYEVLFPCNNLFFRHQQKVIAIFFESKVKVVRLHLFELFRQSRLLYY
jgi:hypothetical protein